MESDFSQEELEYQNGLREAQADAVSKILDKDKGIDEIIHVVENTSWFAKTMRDKIVDPSSPKVACKDKCHWCCHQSVVVTAPEVFRLTKFIKDNFKEKDKSNILNKLEGLDSKSRGKTPTQRAKLNKPCAFLNFGRCQVYEVRPLACQRQTSYDLGDCKKAMSKGFPFGSIVSEKAQLVAYNGAMLGMIEGLKNELPSNELNGLELISAVLTALKDEGVVDRWLNGEECFSECQLNT